MIVVTTDSVPGYRTQAVLGEVMGVTVRATDAGANLSAGFRAIGGGEIPEFTRVMHESRHEVLARMVADAEQRGANAVVALRYDSAAIGAFSECCAYGTAVVVEPLAGHEPGATAQSAQQAALADDDARD